TLTGFATGDGDAQLVTTPASVAVANNSLVLRVMAGKIGAVVEGETNMPGHISIVMRRDASDDPAVGMAYRSYNTGVVPEESFSLPAKTKFAAATVVFSP
ncbi:MAG: hypothetical protein KDB22_20280, partial [Planctomycetales bacterium]|nr:hypothetical protein [Planctomycetales bacterium]